MHILQLEGELVFRKIYAIDNLVNHMILLPNYSTEKEICDQLNSKISDNKHRGNTV